TDGGARPPSTTGAPPAGATVAAGTPTCCSPAGVDQAGPPCVIFTASDGTLSATETITIAIGNTNRAPVLAPIGNKSGTEGSLLTFTISATDPAGDGPTYTTSALPAGATFDAGTRTFSWTPGVDPARRSSDIFTASDGTLTASETVAITIGNTNRAPVLAPIGSKSGSEGSLLTFTISATDADGDGLTYTTSALPAGASFDAARTTFTWTPGLDQAGPY